MIDRAALSAAIDGEIHFTDTPADLGRLNIFYCRLGDLHHRVVRRHPAAGVPRNDGNADPKSLGVALEPKRGVIMSKLIRYVARKEKYVNELIVLDEGFVID